MKEIGFAPLRRWTSRGLRLSNGAVDTFHSADDTNSFTMLVGRAVKYFDARRVVDLGCGCGIPTIEAAARGAVHVHGVDISAANAALARANVSRAGFDDRVDVNHDNWRRLLKSARADLIVSNPPYVPQGPHLTVDGGPDGADIARAMIDAVPDSTRGLALLFGSISNPVSVVKHLEGRGWNVRRLYGHVVPFGHYTSQPTTVSVLRGLRHQERAWFYESAIDEADALRMYVVFGIVAERGAAHSGLSDAMACLLADFQRAGIPALEHARLPVPFECGAYRCRETAVQHRRLNGMAAACASSASVRT